MLRLTSEQERDDDFRMAAAKALAGNQIRSLGETKFDPDTLAWRVVDALNFAANDDGFVRKSVMERVKNRVVMPDLQKVQNGLRIYIPVGGSLWQYAPAATARTVQVFGRNYAEIQQSAGAREERVLEVLEQHKQLGFGLDDPITVAYEAALDSVENVAA